MLILCVCSAGKTAAYALPLLSKVAESSSSSAGKGVGIQGIILAPTRELADQIFRECLRLSSGKRMKIGLLKKNLLASVVSQREKSALSKYAILISTPMRLLYLLRQELIDLSAVNTIILDEVDKLFEIDSVQPSADQIDAGDPLENNAEEEGDGLPLESTRQRSSFLSQIDEILAACSNNSLQRCLFSATIGSSVLELSQSILVDPVYITIGTTNAGASTIAQKLLFVSNEEGKLLAMRQLIQQGLTPPVLVFVQSKERAKELLKELIYDGINVDAIHAERTSSQREKVIEGFRRGDVWVLICTDLMARGVDFKGVQMVINYDLPQTPGL